VDAIAANDAAEGGTVTVAKKKKKVATAPERVGTGTTSFDLSGAIAKIQASIALTQDPKMKAKLAARIQALKDNAQ
jgi:hypothetical protein